MTHEFCIGAVKSDSRKKLIYGNHCNGLTLYPSTVKIKAYYLLPLPEFLTSAQ